MKRLLAVDDNREMLDTLEEIFRMNGFDVAKVSDETGVLEKIESFRPDLVFLDMDLRGDNQDRTGARLLKAIRERWSQPALPVVIISGVGSSRECAAQLEQGANEWVVKPVVFKDLVVTAQRLIAGKNAGDRLLDPVEEDLIGSSKPIMQLTQTIWKAAQAPRQDMLILGETGTGKDLVARVYHHFSKTKPFYIIDCPSVTESLFESELFGHEKDAFNGAKFKKGRFEEAQGGVVLINEIGDVPLSMQAKLLNVLEKKECVRVGSNQPVSLNVVILAATNQDLVTMAKDGRFRQDLLQRLYKSVVVVNPPLRERTEDIPDLVAYFIKRYNYVYQKQVRIAEAELLDYLQQQPWPGNIRQLEHCIQTGVQNCPDDVLTRKDIASFLALFEVRAGSPGPEAGPVVQDFNVDYRTYKNSIETLYNQWQRDYLAHHLAANRWNIAKTAEKIGMSREYLNQQMKRYEIQRPL